MMSNLDIIPMAMCSSNENWEKIVPGRQGSYIVRYDKLNHKNKHITHDFSCTCPAYQYSRGAKYCKHIEQVKDEFCGWHQGWDEGTAKDGRCPKCGNELINAMIGV